MLEPQGFTTAEQARNHSKLKRVENLPAIQEAITKAASNGDFKAYWYGNLTMEEQVFLSNHGYNVTSHEDKGESFYEINWRGQ